MRGSRLVGFATVLIVFLVAAPFLFANEAETLTLEVVGEAPVYGEDVAGAKEAALEDAFRVAVRKVVGTWVTAESFTRNFISIEDSILTKSRGYIKTYETLDIEVTDDTVTLSVRVAVSLSPLQANLESLLGAMDKPRFVLLSESPFVKATLERELGERGFTVIFCPQEWQGRISSGWISDTYSSCSANVLVLAEVNVEYSMFMLPGEKPQVLKGGDIWGCIVTLSISSFWLDTGERVVGCSVYANGSGVSKETAFGQAVSRASPKLIDTYVEKISQTWSDLLLNGRPIELSVTGVSYKNLIKLRHRLNRMYGVRNIIQRKFEDDRALLEVYFTGSSQTLADLIATTNFADMEMMITEVRREGIALRVRSR
jgi:hypothetical protein